MKGSGNPRYGKIVSDEVRRKISIGNSKPKSPHSEETKQKMRETWARKKQEKLRKNT
jgi:hypothetical protein